MDDPSLADKVERTSLDGRRPAGGAPPALTYRVVAGDPAVSDATDDVEVRMLLSLEGDEERVPMVARLPGIRERRCEPEEPTSVEVDSRESPERDRRPSAIPGAVLALGLGAALASGVWFGLPELGWERIDLPWGLRWDLRWISGAAGALGVLIVAMVWRWRSSRN